MDLAPGREGAKLKRLSTCRDGKFQTRSSWGKLSGFTEKETLKTWTVAVTVNSVTGLLVCLIFSKLVPLI